MLAMPEDRDHGDEDSEKTDDERDVRETMLAGLAHLLAEFADLARLHGGDSTAMGGASAERTEPITTTDAAFAEKPTAFHSPAVARGRSVC